MVKAGFSYPPLVYTYRLGQNGIEGLIEEEVLYDSRFVPIVTRPPVPIDAGRRFVTVGYLRDDSMLHGTRLLQLLQYGTCDLTIGQVTEVLAQWFDYNPEVSRAISYEYESYELVQISRNHDTYDESDHDILRILPKGRILCERVFGTAAYQNLCAMRALVSRRAIEQGIIKAVSLKLRPGSIWFDVLRGWVASKVQNAMIMTVAVGIINDKQRRAFPGRIAGRDIKGVEKELLDANVGGRMFDSLSGIHEAISSEIQAIVSGSGGIVQERVVDETLKRLTAFAHSRGNR
jgi:hypothetical protein